MNLTKARELLRYNPVEGVATNIRTGKQNQRTLMLDGRKEYLNRLLYAMFVGPIGAGTVVFKDGDKSNFKLENLALDTNKPAVVTRKASAYRDTVGGQEKTCTQCGEWKPLSCFSLRGDTGMPRGECLVCVSATKKEYYSTEKRQRERRCNSFKNHYGIDHNEYDRLMTVQGGKCAVCATADPSGKTGRFKFFSIDHCHATGKVRGLLCNHCNRGLGLLQDSPKVLLAALGYLERNGKPL